VKLGALPGDWAMSPPQHRPSERTGPQVQIAPFYRASMDVVSEVTRAGAVAGSAKRYAVSDVYQSIARMKIKYDGECPTLTISSRIVDVGAWLMSAGSSSSSPTTIPAWFFTPRADGDSRIRSTSPEYDDHDLIRRPVPCRRRDGPADVAIIMVPCLVELGFLTTVSKGED